MARVRVDTIGLPEVLQGLDAMPARLTKKLRTALAQLGAKVQSVARANAPVLKERRRGRDPGALRDSIKSRVGVRNGEIKLVVRPNKVKGIDAYYARFVESGVLAYGTRRNKRYSMNKKTRKLVTQALRSSGSWRVKPHPFMEPAEKAVQADIDPTLRAAVAAAVSEGL